MHPADGSCVENRVKVFVRHFFQRAATNIAGVVDEDVDPSVLVERRLDDGLAARGSRD